MKTLPREFYIPAGATRISTPEGIEIYTYEIQGRPAAIAFHGRKQSPDFHYRFLNETDRTHRINEYIKSQETRREMVQANRRERSEPSTLKVDDILYCSWGYDQTNIDFYQVTKIVGPRTIEIREIAQKIISSEHTYDHVAPVKGNFRGEKAFRRLVNGRSNSVRINSYSNAYPYNGQPKIQTAVGFGH